MDTNGAPQSGVAGKEAAQRWLRAEIGRGDLAPGFRLVEAELAERYGVTRNSARLALDTLAGEGIVERIPNRGARVRMVSQDEAVQIMECRMVLDGLLSRKAAERATRDDVDRLIDNLHEMERTVAEGEFVKYSELIQNHHALVQAAAGQPTAAALVGRLQGQTVRRQFQLSLRPGRARESLAELRDVVTAIADGDAHRAETAARVHLSGVITAILQESAPSP